MAKTLEHEARRTPTPDGVVHPNWRNVVVVGAITVAAMLALTARHHRPALNIDRGAFKVPTPPVDAPYKGTMTAIAIAWLGAIALVGFFLAFRDYKRTGRTTAMWCTLSAPLIIFPEVMLDVMGAVWYPISHHDHAFTILGRQMGWFIVAGWFGYGSLFSYLTYKVLEARLPTKTLWIAFGGACLGATVFEEILQNMGGMYVYYGNQPLIVLWKLPWWWTPCNAGGIFLAAALAYRLRHELRGWRGVAMLALTPAAMGGIYGFIALPAWIVTNGNYNWWITQIGGLATIAMGLATVTLIMKVVLHRDPFDMSGRAVADLAPEPLGELSRG